MVRQTFANVTDWVFDLDNTLYDPAAGLFRQIEARMTEFVINEVGVSPREADHLRDHYWREHGTTLAGLMANHDTDPDPFLHAVHDIDLSDLDHDPGLASAIGALPGRKIVYTNGSRLHAERVVGARGLDGAFDALFGIEDAGYEPKPAASAFQRVFEAAGVLGHQGAMFEDDARNLAVPHALGMKTVLVGPEEDAEHIHHQTEDLTGFLSRLV